MKLRRTGQKPNWMNKNILRLIRKKKRLWRWYTTDGGKDHASFQAYNNIQNEVKKVVKQAKKKLERKLAKEAKKNAKQFHSYIKKKTANRVNVGPLKAGGEIVTDHQMMCNMLNDFFCSFFTEEKMEEMPKVSQQYKGEQPLTDVNITKENFRKKLSGLKPSAAPGPDKVWARVLHSLADVLAEPLAYMCTTIYLYNKLMEDGAVSDIWKIASVCPVFKKGRPRDYKHEDRGKFFSNRVVKDYNALPEHVKPAANINTFKNSLDRHRGTPSRTVSRPTGDLLSNRRSMTQGSS